MTSLVGPMGVHFAQADDRLGLERSDSLLPSDEADED